MAIEHGGALAGRTLGGYQIVSLLGVGGMAEVYRARDEALEREVAVKVLPRTLAGDPEYVQRFRDEGRRVAALDHPHVVPVYQFGEEDGLLFLVMPLLRESLRERMARDGILQPEVAAGIALEIAQALDAAHGLGLVHRDVKPENVLLDAEGKALLTDFGIARPEARLREAGAARTLASTGLPVGTPEYMAPEQLKAEAVDHRVDVYGLGAVYYELVTGAVPYPGATPYEVAANVLTTPLAPPSSHNVNLWPELDAVTMTALAKNPDERYADVRGFAATLHRAILQHDSSVSGLFLPDGWAEAAAVTQRIPVVALTAADADASERAEFTTGAADFAAARSEAWRERFRLQPALSRKAMVAIAAVVVLLIGLCGGSGLAVLGQFSGSAPGASFLSSLGGGPTDTAGANIPSATHTTGSGSVSSSHATAGAGAPPLSGGGGGPVPPVGPGTPQPTVGPGTPAPTPAPGSTATPTPLPTSTVAPPPGPTPTSTPSISPLVLNPPNGGIVQLNRSNGYCTGQQAITNGNTSPVNWSWNSSSPNIGWIFYRFGNSWFAGMPQTTTAARTTDTLNIAMSCSSGQAYLITMSDGVYSYTFTLHAP